MQHERTLALCLAIIRTNSGAKVQRKLQTKKKKTLIYFNFLTNICRCLH